jgi:hypothetical protein
MARFSGLRLNDDDRRALGEMQRGGKTMTIRVLELLDGGLTVRATAAAVGQYTREVSRVGKRYLARGLGWR